MIKKKKYRYLLIAVMLGMIPLSCSNFLKEIDMDKFVPSMVDHYAALMLQEFNNNTGISGNYQLMTDEVAETNNSRIVPAGNRMRMKPLYSWQKDIELNEDGVVVSNNQAWQALYRRIAIVNYVLEEIDGVAGTPEEIAFTKGEAYFIRAFCYFNLTNLYAEPYESPEQARVTFGVPLRTNIAVVPTYDRDMLDECYQLIESDLAQARSLMERSGMTKSLYHPSAKACDLLISTVKLYKKEYQETIDAATRVIEKSTLMRMRTEDSLFITRDNSEVLYSFQQAPLTQSYMDSVSLVVSPALLNSYHEDDLRKKHFFSAAKDPLTDEVKIFPRKGNTRYTDLRMGNMRSAEAYLNRAEAYAFTNQFDKAREDLRTLLSRRYLNTANIQIPTDNAQLIAFIFQERFKELCFEQLHRWFDLRRMGESLRPDIVHRFSIMDRDYALLGIETFTLLKDDRNYTLSLPRQEKENNPFIFDYERFDKLPEYIEEIIF